MGKLDELAKAFKPQRKFSCSHTTVEVDGVLVRVASEDDNDSWQEVRIPADSESPTHYLIKTEDLLQDPSVIRSARVSTGRDSVAVDEKAQGLMSYLWRDYHVTPYESGVVMRLRVETPISYADPLFRIFASFNEFSGRYSNIDTDFYMPANISSGARIMFEDNSKESGLLYKELLDFGLAKEMARLCLSYRYYTKFYMTISLRHMMEFLTITGLTNRHVVTEFWDVKKLFEDIIKNWTPWASEALTSSPNETNYEWVKSYTDDHKNRTPIPYLSQVNVLDHGVIKLLSVSGTSSLMLGCLDDFPNPLRAFGHGHLTFFARVPIHVFRQWVRHRYGAITQITPNYDWIVEKDMFFIPQKFRRQTGKVGSYTYSEMNEEENLFIRQKMMGHKNKQRERYQILRSIGIHPEIAMMVLPTCFYVPIFVTKPVESIFNFTSLRTDSHAQLETREYANVVWNMFSSAFPDIAKLFSTRLYRGDSRSVKEFNPD